MRFELFKLSFPLLCQQSSLTHESQQMNDNPCCSFGGSCVGLSQF